MQRIRRENPVAKVGPRQERPSYRFKQHRSHFQARGFNYVENPNYRTVKEAIVEQKFTGGETEEQVNDWAQDYDKTLREADEKALYMRLHVAKIEQEKQAASKIELDKHEMALSQEKHEKRMDQERELLEQQAKFHKALEVNRQEQAAKKPVVAKLPKLSITPFDGSLSNWLPFWN